VERGLIWSFIIITIIASIESRHPGFSAPVSSPPLIRPHKGLAVNQRTHDPDPVLAERELSLRGEGFGSRLWPSETSRAGLAPHTPVCRKLYPLRQKKAMCVGICSIWVIEDHAFCLHWVQCRAAKNYHYKLICIIFSKWTVLTRKYQEMDKNAFIPPQMFILF